jgi:uncharacterized damage-inducible protein DinB
LTYLERHVLIKAIRYKAWADQRTLAAVRMINSAEFPSALQFALQQLNHMIRVEELFRARLLAEALPHLSTNTESVPGIAELDQRLVASNLWLESYVQATPGPKLSEAVKFQFVDGQRGTLSRQEILFHIVNHGTYHRGAIGHALDLAQTPRPADTYTVYIHAAEPARRE